MTCILHVATILNQRIKVVRPAMMLLIDVDFRMKCTQCTQCAVRGAQILSVHRLPNHA